jgi:O-antigen/teichoic acid export membrane protein
MSAPYSRQALKQSAHQFITGKAVSAVLTIATLLWLVRVLRLEEYGVYASFTAAMELVLSVSALGLPWMAARYVPDFRLHAQGYRARRFIWSLFGIAFALLAAVLYLLFVGLRNCLVLLNLVEYERIASVYLLAILLEGTGRFVRDRLLGPLMQQVPLRLSQIVRQVMFLGLLILWTADDGMSLLHVVYADVVGAAAGAIVALGGLSRHLVDVAKQQENMAWRPPTWRQMWRTGNHMYVARLITLLASPQTFVLLVQRFLGAEAAALFGFLRSLYDQITGYLPANLLFAVIQPKLVASYVGGGGATELARNANLAGKLSLFALMPMLSIAALSGDAIIALASGGKFPDTGLMFFALMLTLLPYSQRLLLETVAMAAGSSDVCVRAAFTALPAVAAAYGMILAGAGLWSVIVGLGLSYLFFNVIVLVQMRVRCGYRGDPASTFKLGLAAFAAYFVAVGATGAHRAWATLVLDVLVVCAVYLLVAWLLKPFTDLERARLNALANRRLFIW